MDGQDLLVLLEGGEPEPRDHFSQGYDGFVCCSAATTERHHDRLGNSAC